MPRRLALFIGLSLYLGVWQAVDASPITYDFAGTVPDSAAGGIVPFSGSLTINGTPTLQPGLGVLESGSDVSATVTVAGQVFHFVNTPQNPSDISFGAWQLPVQYQEGGPTDFVGVGAGGGPQFAGAWTPPLEMTFYTPGTYYQLGNLADLRLLPFPSSIWLPEAGVGYPGEQGSLTSIELVSTPEPSTAIVFVVLGIAPGGLTVPHGWRGEPFGHGPYVIG